MNIVIAGASGFVGSALSRFLLDAGHRVTGLGTSSRHPFQSIEPFRWISTDTTHSGSWQDVVRQADAVVNLAGRTIFKRWTRAYKKKIVDSRILTTRNIVSAMSGAHQTLISTSAVGYYGNRGDEELYEDSLPGEDFLSRLAVDWEQAARDAEKKGVRVSLMRFGVVLGTGGGALGQMVPAFRKFAGGPLGSGRQWFPWIHMDDLLSAVQFLIRREDAQGAYNFCAPGIVRQNEFARSLGAALKRPALLPAPSPMLRLMMGEMATILLASQKMIPDRLMTDGFTFRFADVETALADLVGPS
jgi:uncharacterized protein (TIGR01777 family)